MPPRAWMMMLSGLLGCLAAAAPSLAAEPPASLFPRGTMDVTLDGSFIHDWDRGNSNFAVAGAGVGYYFLDNVSLGLEVNGYQVFQDQSSYAGGLALLGRHHFFTHGRWTIFADVGFGVFEANDAVPAGGTHFNFTFRSGLGVTYRLREGLDLMGGVRYFHLSNARIEGRMHNPSANGFEPYFGVMWTF